MSKIAFVTGASGCVGRQLVDELIADGWDITALLLPGQFNPFDKSVYVRSVFGDVTDIPPWVVPIGAVIFHLAAKVHSVPKNDRERNEFFVVNNNGTANIARNAVAREAKGFVFISTVAVYGSRVQNSHCDEKADTCPISVYGHSKRKAENSAREILAGRVPYVILRPCVVYGPGDTGNFISLVDWIVNKRLPCPLLDGGKARKNVIHVRDLARVLVYFGENVIANDGQIFNVANPDSLTMCDIVKTINEVADVDITTINIPGWLLKPLAIFGDMLGLVLRREFLFSSRKLDVLISDAVVDTGKLHSELRGRIAFLPLKDGLNQLLKTGNNPIVSK
jgi:nucleoside-diphosphate-sugar epimerase